MTNVMIYNQENRLKILKNMNRKCVYSEYLLLNIHCDDLRHRFLILFSVEVMICTEYVVTKNSARFV